MVVPSSILRTKQNKAKELIARLGDLIEAYRLPNGAFDTTDIGTDVLIFKIDLLNDFIEKFYGHR